MNIVQLPPEILEKLLTRLSGRDICRLRQTCSRLLQVCDKNSVWWEISRRDYGVDLPAGAPAREIYQKLLERFGFCLGLWQRTDLEYYGEVIQVCYDEKDSRIVFKQIVPSDSAGLQRLKFLTISLDDENQVVVENMNGLTFGGLAQVLKGNSGDEMSLRIEVDNIDTGGFLSHMELLRSFNGRQANVCFRSFKSSKSNQTGPFCFQPLMTPRWVEKYHGDFRSESSILERLKPGVFSASYGGHGLELIHLMDGQGVKITGDPNVPFNEVSFRVTSSHRIDLPLEVQTDLRELTKATEDFEQYLVDDDQVSQDRAALDWILHIQYCYYFQQGEFKFRLPQYTDMDGEEITETRCLGRWPAEAHVAHHGFTNDSFIPANFVLFNENKFAVMFLELNSTAIYTRMEI